MAKNKKGELSIDLVVPGFCTVLKQEESQNGRNTTFYLTWRRHCPTRQDPTKKVILEEEIIFVLPKTTKEAAISFDDHSFSVRHKIIDKEGNNVIVVDPLEKNIIYSLKPKEVEYGDPYKP